MNNNMPRNRQFGPSATRPAHDEVRPRGGDRHVAVEGAGPPPAELAHEPRAAGGRLLAEEHALVPLAEDRALPDQVAVPWDEVLLVAAVNWLRKAENALV